MEGAAAQLRSDRLRERMRLQKKLREIEKLEAQEAPLQANQIEKCARKSELQEALAALGPAAAQLVVINPAGNVLASLQMERSSTAADLLKVLVGKGMATLYRHRLLCKDRVLEPSEAFLQNDSGYEALEVTLVGIISTRLAAATTHGDVELWDLGLGSSIGMALEGHGQCVTCAKFSPDGKMLLTASGDSTAKLWSVESCQLLHTLAGLQAHSPILTAEFSPDGLYVVLSQRFGDMRGERPGVTVWRARDGKRVRSLFVSGGMVGHGATWSPAGDLIATCSGEFNAWVFCAQTGAPLQCLCHRGDCRAAFFSPDGRFLCTVLGTDVFVRRAVDMWTQNITHDGAVDARSSAPIVFQARSRGLARAALSSRGLFAWTGSVREEPSTRDAHSMVTVVDLNNGEGTPVAEFQVDFEVVSLEFGSRGDELMVLTTNEPPSLWNAADGTRVRVFGDREASRVVLSPDGRLAATSHSGGQIMVWCVEDAVHLHTVEGAGDVTCFSFW